MRTRSTHVLEYSLATLADFTVSCVRKLFLIPIYIPVSVSLKHIVKDVLFFIYKINLVALLQINVDWTV